MSKRKRILLFTLSAVTLAVVAVVLLLQLLLPRLRYRAQVARTVLTLNDVATATRQYFSTYDTWPRTLDELTTANNPKRIVFVRAPSAGLVDGWGQPISYIPFSSSKGSGAVQSHVPSPNGSVVYEVSFGP